MKLINKEETALLASSIAHCKQSPRTFYSISLNSEIRKFVKELITQSQYIHAVRLICLFKLNEDEEFSPSDLITKEINNLRRSVLEMGQTESSQAKGKGAGKLRAIIELVADYNLGINLPGYLIAELMIQRENSPLDNNGALNVTESETVLKVQQSESGERLLKDNNEVADKTLNDNEGRQEGHEGADELCDMKDAFESLISHGLSDYQKRLQLEKLMKLGSGIRKKLADEWKTICAKESTLNIKKLKYSTKIEEATLGS